MKKIGTFGITAALLLAGAPAEAQDKVETTIATDVVSQYYWRGQELGSISVQPTLGVAYKGFSLTGWGNVGLSDNTDTKEVDFTLGYENSGFHVSVTDYWFNYAGGTGSDPSNRYFRYDSHSTNHVFEANVGYDFGPVALNWYTNFAGDDGTNKSGKRAYSSYFEVTAPFKLADVSWEASAGAVPYYTTFYSNNRSSGFAVCHVALKATKDIKITDSFSVPVFASVAANPSSQKAYLLFGFTLRP